jgi:hypothetical protein
MEFIIKTNLETELPKSIDFNHEALKAELSERLTYYNNLVVTEDSIKDAKADRAKLSKLREAVETKRKEVKAACLAPYTVFESKCKEIVSMIDEPIAKIDAQTEVFKKMEQDKKTDEIIEIYNSLIGDMRDILPKPKLWNEKWLNKGYAIKDIKQEISERITRTSADLELLDSTIEGEFKNAVKIKYLDTLDLSTALAEHTRLKEQALRLREREKLEAERKSALDAIAVPEPAPAPAPEPEPEPAPAPAPEQTNEKLYHLAFECRITIPQAKALMAWLESNNIEYRRIYNDGK